MRACIVLGLLLACARVAVAQPGVTPPAPPVYYQSSPYQPPPQPLPEPLSESTALWWSLGGTIASYGLIFGAGFANSGGGGDSVAGTIGTIGSFGIFLAPSFGHWYAGKYWTRGLAFRLGSIGVLFGGLIVALMASDCPLFGGGHGDSEPCDDSRAEAVLIGTGIATAGMFIYGTVDDIVDAPRRVRRHNAAIQSLQFSLAPLRMRDAGGLALVGRW